jgi:lipopolysaccharide/colanic/teichoic acid biosynthesis glycosyltransferase
MISIAIAIRLGMGPGVFYTQERVGRGGSRFFVYKFRTMLPDRRLERGNIPGQDRRMNHKSTDDPRHTPLGRFLRKCSLDELPQLFNVVRGHMSLVGPRPELAFVVDHLYRPWQHQRHAVKPGITGPWQISERGFVPMHESTEIDLLYAQNLTALTDLRILLATPLSMLRRPGH